jgi:hypothetical protein
MRRYNDTMANVMGMIIEMKCSHCVFGHDILSG